MEVSLYNSTVCRLCGEENDNGTLLYSCEENNQSLSELINLYLPIKVGDDGELPRTICPGCTIQLEATVEFLNLIISGQKVIRELYQREKEYKKNFSLNNSSESEVITEKIVYEINTSDGVYQVEHPIALQVAGLEKPKRKRGRPPKKPKSPEELAQEATAKKQEIHSKPERKHEEPSGKRRRKTPTRFREAVQGKELERIFKEEGVTDGDDSDGEAKKEISEEPVAPIPKVPEVIGHLETSGELVVVIKGKGRGRSKGPMRPTREVCAICGMEFSCVGRYMSHVAQHGPVMYQCGQCSLAFTTRLTFNEHQQETGHEGQNVIPCDNTPDQVDNNEIKTEETPSIQSEQVTNIEIDQKQVVQSLPDLNETANISSNGESTNSHILKGVAEKSEVRVEVVPGPKIDVEEVDNNGATNVTETLVVFEEDKEQPEPTGKPKLKCNHCDKLFSSKQSKSLHIKAVHQGEKPYTCGECGAKFAYPRSLSLHALSHRRHRSTPAKGYACDLCGKVLNHPSSVVYHKEAEHAGQRYVCNKCGKCFKHKQLLQRHQLVHSQLRPYTCKICNSSFKTKANLVNHQLLHTGVKKFSCELCKHKFAHKTSLTLHMRWHTGQKPYTCQICGKSFSQKGNLSEHERIHTGEKPYQCALCPRKFTTSSQHRLHARRHAVERPYVCLHCGKRFSMRATWAAHQRQHRCGVCGGTFPDRWALLKHARQHAAGERPFRCPHCPRTFADCSNLNKHKKHVHKQMSLLVTDNKVQPQLLPQPQPQPSPQKPPSPCPSPSLEESVIYVAYDVDDDDATAFHILDPDQSECEAEISECEVYTGSSLLSPEHESQPNVPVTDEQGNPLHFTMQDGTRLAITSADGKSLQVITQDGQTIPVEINGYADDEEVDNPGTIVHQLNLQKSVDQTATSPVTHYFTIV